MHAGVDEAPIVTQWLSAYGYGAMETQTLECRHTTARATYVPKTDKATSSEARGAPMVSKSQGRG